MNTKQDKKYDLVLLTKTILLQILITFGFIAFFSVVMFLIELDNKFSPLFATIAVGIGAFSSANFYSSKQKSKGYLNGIIIGIITFLIVTLIGLVVSNSGFTFNTVFHFIIIILSAVIGGILGVNKKGKSYI